jgi:hypothetical protein
MGKVQPFIFTVVFLTCYIMAAYLHIAIYLHIIIVILLLLLLF